MQNTTSVKNETTKTPSGNPSYDVSLLFDTDGHGTLVYWGTPDAVTLRRERLTDIMAQSGHNPDRLASVALKRFHLTVREYEYIIRRCDQCKETGFPNELYGRILRNNGFVEWLRGEMDKTPIETA